MVAQIHEAGRGAFLFSFFFKRWASLHAHATDIEF
jgi:hypothetical protein